MQQAEPLDLSLIHIQPGKAGENSDYILPNIEFSLKK